VAAMDRLGGREEDCPACNEAPSGVCNPCEDKATRFAAKLLADSKHQRRPCCWCYGNGVDGGCPNCGGHRGR